MPPALVSSLLFSHILPSRHILPSCPHYLPIPLVSARPSPLSLARLTNSYLLQRDISSTLQVSFPNLLHCWRSNDCLRLILVGLGPRRTGCSKLGLGGVSRGKVPPRDRHKSDTKLTADDRKSSQTSALPKRRSGMPVIWPKRLYVPPF